MTRSMTMNLCVAAASLALAMSVAACNKKAEGTAPSGSAGTTTTTSGKKPKPTHKLADFKTAYSSEVDNMAKMKDPMDKKVAAFEAKMGKPDTDTGRKKTWYALDGDKCTKLELDTKDGSLMDQSTDKADCGL